MKIALVTPSETIPLAGEDGVAMRSHGDASGLDISGQAAVRILQLCRRDRAIPVDDGNLAETVIFRSTRTFGSPAAAEAFAADHAAIPREGELVFDIDGSPRKMTAAVLQAPRSSVAGCTVTTTYAAKGAAIIEAGPPIPEHYINQDLGSGLLYRIVVDSVGRWFEVGLLAPSNDLLGDAATGWTDAGGNLRFRFHRSSDLQSWDHQMIDAPGSPEAVGDGDYIYWARCAVPQEWFDVVSDERIVSNRYGKSITALALDGTNVTLPNYPYDMPSEAAALQADLRSAGYAGTTVASSAAALSVVVRNYHPTGAKLLQVTMSGSSVTAVKQDGVTISLPGYPYSMPSQRATLQTHLRSAGQTWAVVMLYGDQWEIFIPNLANKRKSTVTISPGDPFAVWDFFGNYLGDNPGNSIDGVEENLRDPVGNPLVENKKQFCRLGVTPGPNYQY